MDGGSDDAGSKKRERFGDSSIRGEPMASNAHPSQLSPAPSDAQRDIATYPSYEEAERAVDRLSDQKFPVERIAIIGTGLRSVEQVLGRVTTECYARAWPALCSGSTSC